MQLIHLKDNRNVDRKGLMGYGVGAGLVKQLGQQRRVEPKSISVHCDYLNCLDIY